MAPRVSASERTPTPMLLAMPTSVSELSRHSRRAAMGKPSASISLTVLPNSGARWEAMTISLRSIEGCAASSRRGQ